MLGPQGSGKGTQSERLSAELHIPQITPGTMYRAAIAAGTPEGVAIAPILARGGMVPDDMTNRMIAERLAQDDCSAGYILDGYPRTLAQVAFIDAHLPPFTHVIFLDIGDDVAVARLAQRWVCACGRSYVGAAIERMPTDARRCSACGGVLHRRADDEPDAIRERLHIYHERTEPVIAEYRRRGVLVAVDGSGAIDAVYSMVRRGVGGA